MQSEVQQLSDELFAQQKEIALLRLELLKTQQKLQASHGDSVVVNALDDVPPPHY